jgi:hypothetical protein
MPISARVNLFSLPTTSASILTLLPSPPKILHPYAIYFTHISHISTTTPTFTLTSFPPRTSILMVAIGLAIAPFQRITSRARFIRILAIHLVITILQRIARCTRIFLYCRVCEYGCCEAEEEELDETHIDAGVAWKDVKKCFELRCIVWCVQQRCVRMKVERLRLRVWFMYDE